MRLLTLAFLLLCSLLAPAGAHAQATLTVVVELIKPPSPGARLRLAVCPNMNAFFLEHDCISSAVDAQAPVTRVEFPDIEPGDHAIRVYVDENNNNKLDYGPLGLPAEPYGFSNNPMNLTGPASFDMARFTVTEGMNIQRIKMQ